MSVYYSIFGNKIFIGLLKFAVIILALGVEAGCFNRLSVYMLIILIVAVTFSLANNFNCYVLIFASNFNYLAITFSKYFICLSTNCKYV